VGGGESTLVDDLLAKGHRDIQCSRYIPNCDRGGQVE
jgi:hypothetical protein